MILSELLRIRKGYTESWSRWISIIDAFLKTNPWKYKTRFLNGRKIIEGFL